MLFFNCFSFIARLYFIFKRIVYSLVCLKLMAISGSSIGKLPVVTMIRDQGHREIETNLFVFGQITIEGFIKFRINKYTGHNMLFGIVDNQIRVHPSLHFGFLKFIIWSHLSW